MKFRKLTFQIYLSWKKGFRIVAIDDGPSYTYTYPD